MSYTLGYTTVGGSSGAMTTLDYFGSPPITVASASTLLSISLYILSCSTADNVRVGIYSDRGSLAGPGSLVAEMTGSPASIANTWSHTWLTLNAPASTNLAAGNYWLVFQSQSGFPQINYDAVGSGTFWLSGSAGTWVALPGTLTGGSLNNFTFSCYATLQFSAQDIDPAGIASTTAFGTAVISTDIEPAGIVSTTAFGTAVLTPGTANIAPAGIPSGTAFGLASLSGGTGPSGPTFETIYSDGLGIYRVA